MSAIFELLVYLTASTTGVPPPPTAVAILLEDGTAILLEDGTELLQEDG